MAEPATAGPTATPRLPLFEHVRLGLDLRRLAPATSRAGSIATGGLAVSAGSPAPF